MGPVLYNRWVPPKKPIEPHFRDTRPPIEHRGKDPESFQSEKSKKRKRVSKQHLSHDALPKEANLIPNGISIDQTNDRIFRSETLAERFRHDVEGPGAAAATSISNIEEAKPRDQSVASTFSEETIDRTGADGQQVEQKSKRKRRKKSKSSTAEQVNTEGESKAASEDAPKKFSFILSKFDKATKNRSVGESVRQSIDKPEDDSPPELQDLVPIPRPAKPDLSEDHPAFSALPEWIGKPIYVSDDVVTSFEGLGADPRLISKLSAVDIKQPLPIQSGLLPLLLSNTSQHSGDVCASAVTGSGKTLGYALPIVQGLKDHVDGQLRALVVVPTRELVNQVHSMFQTLLAGTSLRIGTAVGSKRFKEEQSSLMSENMSFKPRYSRKLYQDPQDLLFERAAKLNIRDECVPCSSKTHKFNVDILVCTPGRLVDHIKTTPGFDLKSLEWLVIDEADKLLDQSFQEWAGVLIKAINHSLYDVGAWERPVEEALIMAASHSSQQRLRKVILSATMTNDLDKLDSLRLNSPRLVVLSSKTSDEEQANGPGYHDPIEVPKTLAENAVPVEDAGQKPLVLLSLLARIVPDIMSTFQNEHKGTNAQVDKDKPESDSDTDSDSSSDTDSDMDSSSAESSESITSSSSSEPISSSSSNSASSDSDSMEIEERDHDEALTPTTQPKSTPPFETASVTKPNVLIFANSLESAHRLHSLLNYFLVPKDANKRSQIIIATLTKSNTKAITQKILSSFKNGDTRILIATDLASRGLDIPTLSHVVNYDMPSRFTGYIHRVGRTARAGRRGDAWTLVEHREARWFWNEIGKRKQSSEEHEQSKNVVKRVKLEISDLGDGIEDKYAEALRRLQKEVLGK